MPFLKHNWSQKQIQISNWNGPLTEIRYKKVLDTKEFILLVLLFLKLEMCPQPMLDRILAQL